MEEFLKVHLHPPHASVWRTYIYHTVVSCRRRPSPRTGHCTRKPGLEIWIYFLFPALPWPPETGRCCKVRWQLEKHWPCWVCDATRGLQVYRAREMQGDLQLGQIFLLIKMKFKWIIYWNWDIWNKNFFFFFSRCLRQSKCFLRKSGSNWTYPSRQSGSYNGP